MDERDTEEAAWQAIPRSREIVLAGWIDHPTTREAHRWAYAHGAADTAALVEAVEDLRTVLDLAQKKMPVLVAQARAEERERIVGMLRTRAENIEAATVVVGRPSERRLMAADLRMAAEWIENMDAGAGAG